MKKRRSLSYSISETGANSTEAAESSFGEALTRAGLRRDRVKSIVATGYGRISVPFADKKVTEISCHSLGAYKLFPDTKTVVDIGGQDSKVIQVGSGGRVVDFTMNDKCAAGTGRFLEVMAAKLKVSLDEMGSLSMGANGEVRISSVCTVFAESDQVPPVRCETCHDELAGHIGAAKTAINGGRTPGVSTTH